ncbi:MAG: amidohydrolase [Bacteroidetes bacterium]|nr:amidohydrolase [Bacteroidota bacterium]
MAIAMLSCQQRNQVDNIITVAGIYTATDSTSNANCIAIKGGKIVAIARAEEINKCYVAANNIKEPEKYLYPGFIDAHCHFTPYGLTLYQCNLTKTSSFSGVINKLIEYNKTNTIGWIYGRGWDQNDWEKKDFPNNTVLDSLFPDKIVILKRVDGHAILCNSYALKQAGIDISSKIDGGIVEKKNGKLTGILIDNAMEKVEKLIGNLPEKDAIKYLQKMEKNCYALGLTGVVDCGVTMNDIELLKKCYENNSLSIANILMLAGNDSATLDTYIPSGPYQQGQLRIAGIKVYADGALGSRGACLLEDYTDMPGQRGLILTKPEQIKKLTELALKHNWQVCTHAIGDSANRMVLKIYADALKTKNDKRWRIEHAQVVNYNDYMYFSDYSIIPSVQPTHAISDMPWAVNRLGEKRLPEAYSYKNLLKLNGWIALGTDFPVEDINPLATFYTAVARKDKNGNPPNGFMKEKALTREEALKGMTTWAAKSVFMEKEKGGVAIGMDADFVILDKDIMTIPENEILKTSIVYTISKGQIKYQKK